MDKLTNNKPFRVFDLISIYKEKAKNFRQILSTEGKEVDVPRHIKVSGVSLRNGTVDGSETLIRLGSCKFIPPPSIEIRSITFDHLAFVDNLTFLENDAGKESIGIDALSQMHLPLLRRFNSELSTCCTLNFRGLVDSSHPSYFSNSLAIYAFLRRHLLPIVGDKLDNCNVDVQYVTDDLTAVWLIPALLNLPIVMRCSNVSIKLRLFGEYGLKLPEKFATIWSLLISSVICWLCNNDDSKNKPPKRSIAFQFDFTEENRAIRDESITQLCNNLLQFQVDSSSAHQFSLQFRSRRNVTEDILISYNESGLVKENVANEFAQN